MVTSGETVALLVSIYALADREAGKGVSIQSIAENCRGTMARVREVARHQIGVTLTQPTPDTLAINEEGIKTVQSHFDRDTPPSFADEGR